MPRIKAFCGIRPAPEWAERVIAAPPDFPLDERGVADLMTNPCSFLHLVAPNLDNEFMQGSRDALVYRQAGENLQTFLDKGYLLRDPTPCLYLYSVETRSSGKENVSPNGLSPEPGTPPASDMVYRQTGVWAVTLFDDYLNNTVRKHEYTRVERESGIADYLRQTGIDANPVLIAYRSHPDIEAVIARSLEHPPLLSFEKAGKKHTLHAVRPARDIRLLVRYFGRLQAAYLADGHHRAAALSSYGVERRKFDFKHTGQEEYNYFSSLYFATESLEIKPFHRLVGDINGLTPQAFLNALSVDFTITPVPGPPALERGRFGMYMAGNWYLLLPASEAGTAHPGPSGAGPYVAAENSADVGLARGSGHARVSGTDRGGERTDPVGQLDVTRLQEGILKPLLGIVDPRTDARLRFSGGNLSPETLAGEVDAGKAAVLFTLYPTSISQLMDVADAGMVMPPKSTWFEPKLDLGILTHFID